MDIFKRIFSKSKFCHSLDTFLPFMTLLLNFSHLIIASWNDYHKVKTPLANVKTYHIAHDTGTVSMGHAIKLKTWQCTHSTSLGHEHFHLVVKNKGLEGYR